VAWDVDRKDWRTYRVDRMVPKIPTGPRFAPRPLPDEDLARYVSRRVGATAWRHPARITVAAPASGVPGRLPPAGREVTGIDGHTCEVRTGSDSVELLAVWIGMLGVDFEVTGPPELVEQFRVLGERYRRAVGAR